MWNETRVPEHETSRDPMDVDGELAAGFRCGRRWSRIAGLLNVDVVRRAHRASRLVNECRGLLPEGWSIATGELEGFWVGAAYISPVTDAEVEACIDRGRCRNRS